MGSWFSNMHIRKNDPVSASAIEAYIQKVMAEQRYLPAVSEMDADIAFAIVSREDSQWISVYSDMFTFDDPKEFERFGVPASKNLHTDVLGISCFDSDYLYLNLINADENVNSWAGVGSAAGLGISRRTNLSAWKKKVRDFPAFKSGIQQKYVFAEEALREIEPCVQLPYTMSMASYECLEDVVLRDMAAFLYFKLPETMQPQELPRLEQRTRSLDPCFLGKPGVVECVNTGGESRGLSVFFIGPYVERDEITFSDVSFLKWKNGRLDKSPFTLTKVQLADGQWAYHYHDPGFRIPPKVDERIPVPKRMQMEQERSILVRFVPHGNPRKVLDITVVLVPDKNPAGQTGWNVWHSFGSKAAYIEQYNRNWGMKIPVKTEMLRTEDFD